MLSTTLLALAVSVAGAQAEADRDELTSLLKKKRQALAVAANLLEQSLTNPMAPPAPGQRPPMLSDRLVERMVDTLGELAKVDVALAQSDDQREEILQNLVTKMRKLEKQVKACEEVGILSTLETCLVRIGLADAEIMLCKQKSARAGHDASENSPTNAASTGRRFSRWVDERRP